MQSRSTGSLLVKPIFVLYLSFSLKRDAGKKKIYEGQYHIEITSDFAGKNLSIYVNDSLLIDDILPDTLVTLDVNRFAEENVLMIIDNETDAVTPFNLNKKGSKVTLKFSYLVLHCLAKAGSNINVLSYYYKFHMPSSFLFWRATFKP